MKRNEKKVSGSEVEEGGKHRILSVMNRTTINSKNNLKNINNNHKKTGDTVRRYVSQYGKNRTENLLHK